MTRTTIIIAAGLALATTLPAVPAQAQNSRSFVSSTDSDANNCSLAAPCRSFAGAYAQTNAGGEIDVLNTAGYGPLTITGAISIINDGGTASVLIPSGGIGFTISAGVTDAVSLRGLTFEGAGVGATGIQFNTGQSLTVENCVIRHVTGDGIYFIPDASSNLLVSNTLVADNGGYGILVFPSGSGAVTAVFNRVEVNNNGSHGIIVYGANSTGTINATASESVAAGDRGGGFFAFSNPGQAATTFTLFHSVATNNLIGIEADETNAILTAAQSMVTGNTFAGFVAENGGVVQSYGDNYFNNNGSNVGSLTSISANKQ
jgi:hypothetical protein